MINDLIFDDFLTNNSKRIDFIRKRLSICPEGTLYTQNKNGKAYFVQGFYNDGKIIRKGISLQPDLTVGLIRKELLSKELDACMRRQEAIKEFNKNWPSFNLQDEVFRYKMSHPGVDDNMIEAALRDEEIDDWANAPFEQSMYRVEERTQINSKGLKFRSKSEMSISEKLDSYLLAYRYEEIMRIGDVVIIPDFTIKRADGKIFYWEHAGLTNSQEYLDRLLRKQQLYATKGIYPWDKLIITYDNADGVIDIRRVEFEIQNRLIV